MPRLSPLLILVFVLPLHLTGEDDFRKGISNLNNDDISTRDEAFQKLWATGKPAVPFLQKAIGDESPEISKRASILLNRINLNLGPETPEKKLQDFDNFWSKTASQRLDTLKTLDSAKDFRTIIVIYAQETNPQIRERIEMVLKRSMDKIMQTLLAENNPLEASQLLKKFPEYKDRRKWLAGIHAENGTLPTEIARLEKENRKEDHPLLLACYRRNGDLQKALTLAKSLNDEQAIITLSMVAGDALPYLTWCEQLENLSPAQKEIYAILRVQEEGRHEQALELAKKLLEGAQSEAVLLDMQAIGYYDLTLPIMQQGYSRLHNGLSKTTHQAAPYISRFQFPDDPDKQQEWITSRIESIAKTCDYEGSSADDLFYTASRLETFGKIATARRLLDPLEKASREAGNEHWQKYLNRVPLYFRNPLLISTIKDDWAEEDYLALLEFFHLGPQVRDKVWSVLSGDDKLSLRERFDEMATFFGWSKPGREERNGCWDRMIKRGEGDDEFIDLIISTHLHAEPAHCLAKAMLARAHRFEKLTTPQQFEMVRQFVYLRDWEQALSFALRIKNAAIQSPGLLAGIYKRLGNEKTATTILTRSSYHNLNTPARLGSMARDLQLCGLFDDANAIWKRIAMETEIKSGWQSSFNWMLNDSRIQKNRKREKAISLALVIDYIRSTSFTHASGPLSANLRRQVFRGLDLIDAGQKGEGLRIIRNAASPLAGSDYPTETLRWHLSPDDYPEAVDLVFDQSYQHLKKVIADSPNYHLARNSIAWMCSVTGRHLDEALIHSRASLKNEPRAAYCDTLGRIYRNLNNRGKELEWHERAVKDSTRSYFNQRSSILTRYDWILENPKPVTAE